MRFHTDLVLYKVFCGCFFLERKKENKQKNKQTNKLTNKQKNKQTSQADKQKIKPTKNKQTNKPTKLTSNRTKTNKSQNIKLQTPKHQVSAMDSTDDMEYTFTLSELIKRNESNHSNNDDDDDDDGGGGEGGGEGGSVSGFNGVIENKDDWWQDKETCERNFNSLQEQLLTVMVEKQQLGK